MEAKYKVSITKDYRRMVFIVLTPLFILMSLMMSLGFLLEYKVILPEQITYEIVLPIFVMVFFVIGYFITLIEYYKEDVIVGSDYMESSCLGVINFSQIQDYKLWTYSGYITCFIKIETGKKLAIGPTSNFSTSADIVFTEFIKDFERSIKSFQKNEKIILDK
jgi:hypothetical protein